MGVIEIGINEVKDDNGVSYEVAMESSRYPVVVYTEMTKADLISFKSHILDLVVKIDGLTKKPRRKNIRA